MAVLESRLIIGATDETQAAFASVMARINELQGKLASVNGALGGALPRAIATPSAVPTVPSAAPARPPSPAPAASGFWETVGSALGAVTGYEAIRAGFHEAMAQQHERMRQEVAAMTPEEIAKGEKMGADLAARYPSVPQSEIMHSLRTARTVTGSFEEAEKVVEPLTKLRVIAQAASPHSSTEEMSEEFDKLVKALEIAGVATDDKRLHSYIGDIAKSLNAFGDQLKPSDYFEMLKYARQAAPGLSERFLMTTLATFGTEIGGASAGTAAAAFNQTMISGNPRYFTHTGAMTLHELGLVGDEDLARTKTGEIMGMKPFHHVKDWRLAKSDPDLWITQDLLPAIKAKFGDDKDVTASVIGQIFNNRNAANLALQIATQQTKFGKNADLWKEAQGAGAADVLTSKDATTAISGVGNSVTRAIAQQFDTDLFGQIASGINKALGWLTPTPAHRGDLGTDVGTDVKGWADLFKSIRVGGPQTTEQWHDDMRANSSLWGAGYRPGDLEQESAREHSRAVSRTPLSFKGASDWESHAPQAVNVSGQAQVDHTLHLDITLDPALRAKIDQIESALEFTVPLVGDGAGRMDSDAGPHRAGGIGHQ